MEVVIHPRNLNLILVAYVGMPAILDCVALIDIVTSTGGVVLFDLVCSLDLCDHESTFKDILDEKKHHLYI